MKKGLIIGVILAGFAIFLIASYASFNNRNVELVTTFDETATNRVSTYESMWKIIAQKAQVTKAYDTSFQNIVRQAMASRADGAGILMKWVQESNPTLQVGTVQELYKDLSRTIESKREEFLDIEKKLASIKQQHSKFLRSFPNNLINVFMGVKEIDYKPITSSRTDKVFETGKDDDVKVF